MTGLSDIDDVPTRITGPDWPAAGTISSGFQVNHFLITSPFLFDQISCVSWGQVSGTNSLNAFCFEMKFYSGPPGWSASGAHYNCLTASASQIAGIIGACHHA